MRESRIAVDKVIFLSLLVLGGCTTAPPSNPINMVDNATLCQAVDDVPITDGRLKTVLWNEVLRRSRTGQIPKGLCNNYPVKANIYEYIPQPKIVAKVNIPTENDEELLEIEFAKEAAIQEIRKERDDLREYVREIYEIDDKMIITTKMF